MIRIQSRLYSFVFVVVMMSVVGLRPALAADPKTIDDDALAALNALYSHKPKAREIAKQAEGILIFPSIAKAGFILGAEYGDGVLIQYGETTANYNIAAVSFGLQAGVQSFAYVMFMMSDKSMKHLNRGRGWELGSSPGITIIDASAMRNMSTTTLKSDVYAFTFNGKGLMGGLAFKGTKITRRSK